MRSEAETQEIEVAPRDATTLLAEDVLRSLAREHLADLPDIFTSPDIPPRKLRHARAAHGVHLAASEPLVVLFDGSFFGTGDDGFLATPSQFCWKNFLEHPRRIRWDDLAHTPVYALDRHVEIARGHVQAPWNRNGPDRVRAFLVACGRRTRLPTAPYRDAPRIPEASARSEAIVARVRRALGELDWVHYRPSIPAKMVASARIVHERHLAAHEEILVLYDDTLFGAGNDGIVFTDRGICWRNFWGSAEAIAWSDMDPDLVFSDGDLLFVNGDATSQSGRKIDLRMRPGVARIVAGALQEVSRMVR